MLKEKTYYNIQCDGCGQMLDDQYWDEQEGLDCIMSECGWKTLGHRHYCEDCWHYDDDDNIVTSDCRKYDQDGNEVADRAMSYMEVGEWMTLTQFRTSIAQNSALYSMMVGTLYKGMLYDDLRKAWAWFKVLVRQRRGTPEYECYETFQRCGIFRRVEENFYQRRYH